MLRATIETETEAEETEPRTKIVVSHVCLQEEGGQRSQYLAPRTPKRNPKESTAGIPKVQLGKATLMDGDHYAAVG